MGRATKKGRTSRHRGVSWDKRGKKWRAQIGLDGKPKSLGTFVDEDEAGRAYDAAVRKHYPHERPMGWKRFNFPSADGEEGSADGGDDAGSAHGDASSSSSDDVDARAEEEDEGFLLLTRLRRRTPRAAAAATASTTGGGGGGGGFLV